MWVDLGGWTDRWFGGWVCVGGWVCGWMWVDVGGCGWMWQDGGTGRWKDGLVNRLVARWMGVGIWVSVGGSLGIY